MTVEWIEHLAELAAPVSRLPMRLIVFTAGDLGKR